VVSISGQIGIESIFLKVKTYSVNPSKTFRVFGEPVEILIPGEMTGGRSTTLTQVSPPGGGPPPHSHTNEDETFFVLEGEYEFLEDGEWRRGQPARAIQAMRGSVHTFRNVGTTPGKMLVFVAPSGMEQIPSPGAGQPESVFWPPTLRQVEEPSAADVFVEFQAHLPCIEDHRICAPIEACSYGGGGESGVAERLENTAPRERVIRRGAIADRQPTVTENRLTTGRRDV
jgi:quercetin dioxygenase-like cupin family protein